MSNLSHYSQATRESVWATFQEMQQYLKELHAETDRQREENDRRRKENDRRKKEANRRKKEADRRREEADRRREENDRYLTEKFAKTEKLIDQNALRMKELQKTLGGMANSHGSFAEEYFFNSFEEDEHNFFGEHFDEIRKNIHGKKKDLEDEYDIVLYNGVSVAIIEVKYKAHKDDVYQVLNKAETFRIFFPDYKDFKIYLGLASMAFYPDLEQECINKGIAIIKQVGDNVVINDEHLKVF